jgi:hypothetical protein
VILLPWPPEYRDYMCVSREERKPLLEKTVGRKGKGRAINLSFLFSIATVSIDLFSLQVFYLQEK